MEPKYKVGDEVTIRTWKEIEETLDGNYHKNTDIIFTASMYDDLGKTYKITDIVVINPNYPRYQLNDWWYVEDWIKPKETKSIFSDKLLIFFMCLQLLSGNKPDKSIFINKIPLKCDRGFDWKQFQEKLSMRDVQCPLPNWPILALDIEFAELLLTRMYEYPVSSIIDIDYFKKHISFLIDDIIWNETPEGFGFWKEKHQYYESKSDLEILKNQEQPNKKENHEIKLQRKKSTIIRGTVPEGSITRGRKRKVAITVGYLSNTVCIGG